MKAKRIRELLFQSFDRDLTAKEQQILDEARRTSPELAAEESLLHTVYQKLSGEERQSFGPWFVDRTMNRIWQLAKPKKSQEWSSNGLWLAFRRVVLFASFILIVIMAFNLSTSAKPDLANALGIVEISMDEMADPFSYLIME